MLWEVCTMNLYTGPAYFTLLCDQLQSSVSLQHQRWLQTRNKCENSTFEWIYSSHSDDCNCVGLIWSWRMLEIHFVSCLCQGNWLPPWINSHTNLSPAGTNAQAYQKVGDLFKLTLILLPNNSLGMSENTISVLILACWMMFVCPMDCVGLGKACSCHWQTGMFTSTNALCLYYVLSPRL